MLRGLCHTLLRFFRPPDYNTPLAKFAQDNFADGGRCHECGQTCDPLYRQCDDCWTDKQW